MTLPLRTMHDRVLVRRVRHAVSDGGIIIPEGHGPAQEWHGSQTVRGEFTVEGEVIAVGPGPECVERREIAGVEFLRDDLLATGAAPESPEPVRLNRLMTALRRVARPAADVAPGDRIFFPSWARKWEMRVDGEDLIEVQGEDVVAVMREGEIVPLRHRILVHHERVEAKIGSFFVPETAQKKTFWARVAAVGAGKILRDGRRVPNGVDVGDRVYIFEGAETRITINGADNIIMRIDDVLAVDEDATPLPIEHGDGSITVFHDVPDVPLMGMTITFPTDVTAPPVEGDASSSAPPPAEGATGGTPAPEGVV